eukprot:234564_1
MSNTLYVVGCNENGELGIGINRGISQLMNFNECNPSIIVQNINIGHEHCIITDINNNLWALGSNTQGACCVGETDVEMFKFIFVPQKITYFKDNNINNIQKIFTTVGCNHNTFFTTTDNTLYGIGTDSEYQLGLPSTILTHNHFRWVYDPVIIKELQNKQIINIVGGSFHNIVLCLSSNIEQVLMIVEYWYKGQFIPNPIISLLINYSKHYKMYATGAHDRYSSGANPNEITNQWQLIKPFSNVAIINISAGYDHTLFLDSNGNVWSCGESRFGQLGLGTSVKPTSTPTLIPFFE